MNVQKLVAAPLLAIALMCMNVTPAEAGVFSVTPVRIFMTPRDRAVAITLTNEGDSDVALQADIGVWGQKPDGTDEMQPTEDLLLAPPIIKLAPRQRQVVRLASLRAPDPARQLTYRMVIREVPEATAPKDGSMEVPIALALSMPVFITPPGAKREVTCDLGRGAAQAVLAVCTNSGNAYAQVREATIKRNNAELARFEGGAYVLPGVRRSIPLKAQEAVAAGPAQLNVVFDDGKAQVFEVTLPEGTAMPRRLRGGPRPPRFIIACAVAAASSCAYAQAPMPVAPPAAQPPLPKTAEAAKPAERLLPLAVTVNGSSGGDWVLLEKDGVLYAPADAFEEWRLTRRPNAQPLTFRGQTWFALGSVPGFEARLNHANQSVDLIFSPTEFAATRVSADAPERMRVTDAEPALFLNYDTNLTLSKPRGSATSQDLGFLSEVGYATRFGVLTSSYVGRNLTEPTPSQLRTIRRLETTFTHDFPDQNLTLRLGDATTRVGLWGRSLYFGGVQLARNFALTPGFVTQPIPLLSGTSSAPSTVELYINDALRQTSNVPTGPFVIDNFPLLTGAGQARIVVRDVLGRETVIVQPFFTHSNLLEPGLSDWSAEMGAVRRNLGTLNADYGTRFASGYIRRGLSRNFTAEAHAEWAAQTQDAGLGASFTLPFQTLGLAAFAVSRDQQRGDGRQWVVGLEHDNLRQGLTLHATGATRGFRMLAFDNVTLASRRELSASYSFNADRFGSLGLGFAKLDTYDRGTLTTYSANYSLRLSNRSSLTFSYTKVKGSSSGTTLGVSLVVPLDNNITASSNVTHKPGETDGYVSVSKGLTAETGLAWRALSGLQRHSPYAEGGLYYQGNKILLTGDTSVSRDQQTVRVGAQGGLVFMGSRFFASRRVDNSFALVEVPGYANVGVGFQGTPLTRTDENGQALIPRLVPYQANSIRLDPTELPINAELDSIEQIAVPPWRSGVRVTFPVRSGRGALLRIVFDDDEPAPAGAQLELVGDKGKEDFFVARRGEAFVTGLQAKNTLRLKWRGASCTFTVELPPGKVDEIARVGPITCSGIRRPS